MTSEQALCDTDRAALPSGAERIDDGTRDPAVANDEEFLQLLMLLAAETQCALRSRSSGAMLAPRVMNWSKTVLKNFASDVLRAFNR